MISFEIFIVLIIFSINVQCQQNVNFFTEEENRFLFQSDIVPEYEIVDVSHKIRKRSLEKYYGQVFLKTFKRNLTLYLEPTDSILFGEETKVWSATPNPRSPQGVKYKVISNYNNTNFQTLHDVSNMAAVTMEKDENGFLKLYGHIGDDLVIQPLPDRMLQKYKSKIRNARDTWYYRQPLKKYENSRSHYYQTPRDSFRIDTTPHVIHKLPPVKLSKENWPNSPHKYGRKYNARKPKILKFKTVYPEILVYVDNGLYKKLGRDVEAIKKYIAAYWTAVDLRFRQLKNPMVRINIAGIVLSMGKKEVPFIKNSIYKKGRIDADKVLIETGQHLLSNTIFTFRKDYDLSMTMTSRDMCNLEPTGENCNTMGYAYVAAACSILKDEQMVEAVGMVEDNGGFKGIMLSAHELGHLLGVEHDENVDCNSDGIIDDGYIMEEKLSFTSNSFDWSLCSLRNFSYYLSHDNTTCLRNKPNIGGKIKTFLPGLEYSLEYQCEQYLPGSKPCKSNIYIKNVCMGLECTSPLNETCTEVVAAAEGSSCGTNSICLDGKCISPTADYYHYGISNNS